MEKIIMLTGAVSMILLGLFWQLGSGKVGGLLVSVLALVAAGAAVLIGFWFSVKGLYLPALLSSIAVMASFREAILRLRNGPDSGKTVGHVAIYMSYALLFGITTFFPLRT